MGRQGGCFYSPEVFRRVFKPRLAKLIAYLKTKTKAKCAYHCCGSVFLAIPDMIDIGVDILHPLQPTAKDNEDTAKIKRRVRGQNQFSWGNEHPEALRFGQELRQGSSLQAPDRSGRKKAGSSQSRHWIADNQVSYSEPCSLFLQGLQHGHNVFDRDIGGHVV